MSQVIAWITVSTLGKKRCFIWNVITDNTNEALDRNDQTTKVVNQPVWILDQYLVIMESYWEPAWHMN